MKTFVASLLCTAAAASAAFLCLTTSAANANEASAQFNPIGINRIIYVCLSGQTDEAINEVSKTYDALDWNGFAERDLLVYEIQDKTVHLVKQDGAMWRRVEYTHPSSALSRRISCSGDLDYVLIGKDGGEKMRWQGSLPRGALFDTIDAMPMRQYEMRRALK